MTVPSVRVRTLRRLTGIATDSRTRFELVHTALGQALIVLVYLVGLRVLTQLLPTFVYGQVSLALAGFGLLSGVFVGPLLSAQLRFHPSAVAAGHAKGLYRLLGSLLLIGILLASMSGTAAIAAGGRRFGLPDHLAIVALFIFVWVAFDALVSAAGNVLNAERKQGRLALLRILDESVRLIASILAIVALGAGLAQYLGGRISGAFVVVAAVIAATRLASIGGRRKKVPSQAHTPPFNSRRLLAYVIPLIPIAGINWAIHLADRYILAVFHGSAEVGLYSATYGLASHPFLMLGGVATLVFRPQLYLATDGLGCDLSDTRRRWIGLILIAGGPLLAVMLLARRPVVDLLLAVPYRGASGLMFLLGPAYFLFAVSQVFENQLLAAHRSKAVLACGVTSMSVSLGSALLLIPSYASIGAGWATLCGMVSYCAASWLLARSSGRKG